MFNSKTYAFLIRQDYLRFQYLYRPAVLYLVNNGAQVNMLDNQGCLPLHLAAWTGNADICRVLVEPLNANDVNTQVCLCNWWYTCIWT